ncbi:3' terminal RNA ribose 2'-O-methyltransferase Hen1 [Fodinicola feengrottensis]|uniref:Small RNA 2'-O-methyltransferase n=1 Tax=Fodinicola feengrottensis TaxID=435914 RepID=A0ABP4TNX2_9ACTN
MLLTIATTHQPATDLGFLLHKHPDRVQTFDVTAGHAHVFYPAASEHQCTAALMLEIDPIALVRGRGRKDEGFALGQYVNDRPYAASSMLAVALGKVFRTAMAGRCDHRPELVDVAMPLVIQVPTLPCKGGADLAARLFEPLGWQVEATEVPLDETIPEWGSSRYVALTLTGTMRLADALNHLYVLMPVLDDAKHYWVSPDEVDKLVRAGDGWLSSHPAKELISRRYLAHRGRFVRSALARLAEVDDTEPEEMDNAVTETQDERPIPLVQHRHGAVLAALRSSGARRVADLGCGEGALVGELLAEPAFTEVLATDVSVRALEIAARRLHLETMPERKKARLRLFQSSLNYRDERLSNLDAAVLMEVIEHVDPPRLSALERTVFGEAKPKTVLVTTPNGEYNVRYETLPAGRFRHRDHRFEWSRGEFQSWAGETARTWGYQVRYLPVGTDDPEVGSPTQMAVFTRVEVTA